MSFPASTNKQYQRPTSKSQKNNKGRNELQPRQQLSKDKVKSQQLKNRSPIVVTEKSVEQYQTKELPGLTSEPISIVDVYEYHQELLKIKYPNRVIKKRFFTREQLQESDARMNAIAWNNRDLFFNKGISTSNMGSTK
jgi:hypothetical protein